MANRITQILRDVAVTGTSAATRVTQILRDVAVTGNPFILVTAVNREIAVTGVTTYLRVTGFSREVVQTGGTPSIRVTSVHREIVVRVTRPLIENDDWSVTFTEGLTTPHLEEAVGDSWAAAFTEGLSFATWATSLNSDDWALAFSEGLNLAQWATSTSSDDWALALTEGLNLAQWAVSLNSDDWALALDSESASQHNDVTELASSLDDLAWAFNESPEITAADFIDPDDDLAFTFEGGTDSGVSAATLDTDSDDWAWTLTEGLFLAEWAVSTDSDDLAWAFSENYAVIVTIPDPDDWAWAIDAESPSIPKITLPVDDEWAWTFTERFAAVVPRIVSISGIDRSDMVLVNNPINVQRQMAGKSTASFSIYDRNQVYKPQFRAIVRVSDVGQIIFGGRVAKVVSKYLDECPGITYEVQCDDFRSILHERTVRRSWPAGSDVLNVLLDIANNFVYGEGIDFSTVYSAGILPSDLVIDNRTAAEAFDTVAKLDNAQWWIDENFVFHWVPPYLTDSVFLQTWDLDYSPAPDKPDLLYTRWSALEGDYNRDDYRNVEIVKSNYNIQAGAFIETIIASGAQSMYPTLFPVVSAPEVTINGVPVTVLNEYVDPPLQDEYYYIPHGYGIWNGITRFEPAGTVIVITYGGYLTNAAIVEDAAEIAITQALQGGSGRVEHIDDLPDTVGLDLALQAAQQLIDRYKLETITLKYQTDWSGPLPGYIQFVDLPDQGITTDGISDDFQVQSVAFTNETGPVLLPSGSLFRKAVVLTNTYPKPDWSTQIQEFTDSTKQKGVPTRSENHGWSFTGDVVIGSDWEQIEAAPINFEFNGIITKVTTNAYRGAGEGLSYEFDIRDVDNNSIFQVTDMIEMASGDSGPNTITTFAVNPFPYTINKPYYLWGISVGDGDPALAIKIQVTVER